MRSFFEALRMGQELEIGSLPPLRFSFMRLGPGSEIFGSKRAEQDDPGLTLSPFLMMSFGGRRSHVPRGLPGGHLQRVTCVVCGMGISH